jgi:hypothetical protein
VQQHFTQLFEILFSIKEKNHTRFRAEGTREWRGEAFSPFDGQRLPTMQRAGGPVGRNQSHCARDADVDRQEMADDGTRGEDSPAPNGGGLSSMWLCAGSRAMARVIGGSGQMCQGYRVHKKAALSFGSTWNSLPKATTSRSSEDLKLNRPTFLTDLGIIIDFTKVLNKYPSLRRRNSLPCSVLTHDSLDKSPHFLTTCCDHELQMREESQDVLMTIHYVIDTRT